MAAAQQVQYSQASIHMHNLRERINSVALSGRARSATRPAGVPISKNMVVYLCVAVSLIYEMSGQHSARSIKSNPSESV